MIAALAPALFVRSAVSVADPVSVAVERFNERCPHELTDEEDWAALSRFSCEKCRLTILTDLRRKVRQEAVSLHWRLTNEDATPLEIHKALRTLAEEE